MAEGGLRLPARRRSLVVLPNHAVFRQEDGYRVERAEAELIRELREGFDHVGLAAFLEDDRRSKLTALTGLLRPSEIEFTSLSFVEGRSTLRKLVNYLSAFAKMPFLCARYSEFYIFAPGSGGIIAALWAICLRKPYGLYVRGVWGSDGRTRIWWRAIFRNASFLIVTGEAFRKRLSAYCGSVVNEVPLTTLRPEAVASTPVGTSGSPVTMLFVGRLIPEKGVFDIIHAMEWLRDQRGVSVVAEFAGGGTPEELDALRAIAEQCGTADEVKMLGHLEEPLLRRAYQRASVFVFPSYYPEGFPRVLYEAMMFSLPIVTAEIPGLEGVLIDNENCLRCRVKDPVSLGQAILRLIDDPNLALRIGSAARRAVEQVFSRFDQQTHAQQLIALSSQSARE